MKKEYIYTCHLAVQQKLAQHCTSTTLYSKKKKKKRNSMEVPRKLNRELPYDPAIPLLSIYLDKTYTEKDTCARMFTKTLFTTAKAGKQPKVNQKMNGLGRCDTHTQ